MPCPSCARAVTALVIPFLFATACVAAPAADTDKASIRGIVVDTAGKPVAGAEVRDVSGRLPSVRTDAGGRFTMVLDSGSTRYTDLLAGIDNDALLGWWNSNNTSWTESSAEAKITLKPSRTVTARVVDALGKPVSGAKASTTYLSSLMTFADSDAQGIAALRVPEDMKLTHIIAMKPGVGFDYYENIDGKWPNLKPLPQEVTLTLDGASRFQVRALDSKGKPIVGAKFCPWYFEKLGKNDDLNTSAWHPAFPLWRETNAEGLATFDFLPAQLKGGVPITCHSSEWHQQKDPQWPADGKEVMETTLLRCAKASGLVLHEDGKPAAGILLQAEGRGRTNHYYRDTQRTREDGTFEFSMYPEQSYLIAVTDQDWAAPSIQGFIVHEGEERADLLFTLGKGTLVSGAAVNASTGEPLARKTITVVQQGASIHDKDLKGPWNADAQESLVRWATTDKKGRYSIRLGPGTYEVKAAYAQDKEAPLQVGDQPTIERNFRVIPTE